MLFGFTMDKNEWYEKTLFAKFEKRQLCNSRSWWVLFISWSYKDHSKLIDVTALGIPYFILLGYSGIAAYVPTLDGSRVMRNDGYMYWSMEIPILATIRLSAYHVYENLRTIKIFTVRYTHLLSIKHPHRHSGLLSHLGLVLFPLHRFVDCWRYHLYTLVSSILKSLPLLL